MSPVPAPLAPLEAVVYNIEQGVISHAQGLAQLKARQLNPNSQTLADAVGLLSIRDGLLEGTVDPYDVLSLEPRLYTGDMREHAVGIYDGLLCDALRRLGDKPTQAAAS